MRRRNTKIYSLMKRIALVLLVLLLMCGCGTKKATTVVEHASSVAETRQDHDEELNLIIDDYSHVYDSIVEHIYELIITDSSGNVISKAQEHSLDKFKSKKNANNAHLKMVENDSTKIYEADSTRNCKEMNEEVTVRAQKPPWGYWFSSLLFVCVVLLYWRLKHES